MKDAIMLNEFPLQHAEAGKQTRGALNSTFSSSNFYAQN